MSSKALKMDANPVVLDLACGEGRNGLNLVGNSINTVFADINGEALAKVELAVNRLLNENKNLAKYWQVDFEQENTQPLLQQSFNAILVFRYLHRPLFNQIKAAIKPGGMIIYETFTTQQAQFGRPKNSDFLLKPKELKQLFSGWKILHYFDGVITAANGGNVKQAIAQIVAIKPE